MFSTNGRTRRRNSGKANANNRATTRTFICSTCGKEVRVSKVEFGEAIVCDACGSTLTPKFKV